MDRSSYEKLSIRDSAKSLKKYGSTSSKQATKNENYIKHFVSNNDTLQGIALKYDVTIEQIRRANKLFTTDSLFLREYLLIPVPENASLPSHSQALTSSKSVDLPTTSSARTRTSSFEEENISDFLLKIDASIASTKEVVQKSQGSSKFTTSFDSGMDLRRQTTSNLKRLVNNNGGSDYFLTPNTVVVTQGRKVKSSIRRLEQQQDELFEL